MDKKLDYTASILKTIGHPIRVDIIRKIYDNQILSVSEIQDLLHISQPVISLHLGILKKKGIISSFKKGKQSFYFIKKQSVSQVIQILYYDSI